MLFYSVVLCPVHRDWVREAAFCDKVVPAKALVLGIGSIIVSLPSKKMSLGLHSPTYPLARYIGGALGHVASASARIAMAHAPCHKACTLSTWSLLLKCHQQVCCLVPPCGCCKCLQQVCGKVAGLVPPACAALHGPDIGHERWPALGLCGSIWAGWWGQHLFLGATLANTLSTEAAFSAIICLPRGVCRRLVEVTFAFGAIMRIARLPEYTCGRPNGEIQ